MSKKKNNNSFNYGIIIILAVILLFSVAAIKARDNEKKAREADNLTTNTTAVIGEDLENKPYDVNEYPNIKKETEKLIKIIKSKKVSISSVDYDYNRYSDGLYYRCFTAYFGDEDEYISLKFSPNEEVMIITIHGKYNDPGFGYVSSPLIIIDYLKLNKKQQDKFLSIFTVGGDEVIGDYTVSKFKSTNFIVISNNKYDEEED